MTAPTESPAAPAPTKYRYFTVTPGVIRLKADDIAPHLPPGAWTGRCDLRELKLSAAEVLETNVPRIRLARLRELFPACIQAVEGAPEWVRLPPAAVALAYLPETHREPILESPGTSAAPDPVPIATEPSPTAAGWKRLRKPVLAPPPAPPLTFASRHLPETANAPLRHLFQTDGAFNAQRLADLVTALPGMTGCIIRRGADSTTSGSLPALPDGGDVREFSRKAASVASALEPFVTLYAGADAISFLHIGGSTLVVAHREPGLTQDLRAMLRGALDAIEAI